MRIPHRRAVLAPFALLAVLLPAAAAAADSTEVRGAAILEHPCGQTAVKHMGLLHAGKFDEAFALATPEVQAQWQAMPAPERKRIFKAMKDMSETEAAFSAEIKSYGVLVIEGDAATLTVEKKTKTENGTVTETQTQRYAIGAEGCRITT
jgi:hypothetical protein